MSATGPAVFLSYASQDAAAALRICAALRDAGIEVWFDQSELRGGDVWDQKIRQQIRKCSLVIPIVSAHTQSRLEGYFRREWRMAVDRTQDMADGVPFLVPVVIDETPEKSAHVPEAFRSVQWTRLPGGETAPEFAQRISRLLEPRAPEPPVSSGVSRALVPASKPRVWKVALIVVAVALLAAGYYQFQKFAAVAMDEETATPAPPAQPAKDPLPGK
ncbi:MAG: toll/interleukin-1 receptor domain-containing protein [Pseudomonadota bacterium]